MTHGRSSTRARVLRVCSLTALLCCAAGCRDECDPGESKCSGTTLLTCETDACRGPGCIDRSWWEERRCPEACVHPDHRDAFCAASADADPNCDGKTGAGYCDGSSRVSCFEGFVTARTSCAAAQSCVELDGRNPLCALSTDRDARCDALQRGSGQICDGNSVGVCEQGYLVSLEACPLACAAPTARTAFCAASSATDPRCEAGATRRSNAICVGDAILARCDRGYLRQQENCAARDRTCFSDTSGAYCARGQTDADAGEVP